MPKTATVTFRDIAARRAFVRAWLERTEGDSFEFRDLLTTDGAERAADIALLMSGVRVEVSNV